MLFLGNGVWLAELRDISKQKKDSTLVLVSIRTQWKQFRKNGGRQANNEKSQLNLLRWKNTCFRQIFSQRISSSATQQGSCINNIVIGFFFSFVGHPATTIQRPHRSTWGMNVAATFIRWEMHLQASLRPTKIGSCCSQAIWTEKSTENCRLLKWIGAWHYW